MMKNILFFAVGFLMVLGVSGFTVNNSTHDSQSQVLRHVVLLDLNESVSDSVIKQMESDLANLEENISQIKKMEFGSNIQPEADYSHCMFLTFESVEDLEAYEEHPMHLEFASTYGKYVIKKTEVDYWY